MKIFINGLLIGLSILFFSLKVTAAELDTSKIYNCSGIINGKQENILYDARVIPEKDCQQAADMAAGFAKSMGQTINSQDIKKSCIEKYNSDKAKVLKLNAQGKCKMSLPGQPIMMINN